MPYRIDVSGPPDDALDLLVELGALDIEAAGEGLAAILPDGVAAELVAARLGRASVTASPAVSRDNGSVWLLHPKAIRIGSIVIAPPEMDAPSGALRLLDSDAFGSGYHPTTALCIESLQELLTWQRVDSILDVGTGSGILALAALRMGVTQAVGLDIDEEALKIASGNARLNQLADRLQLVLGGPGAVDGTWPLVVANVLAAPLMEMAPMLVRRVGMRGRLVLSGIHWSLEREVRQVYERLGMCYGGSTTRAGWTVLVTQSTW